MTDRITKERRAELRARLSECDKESVVMVEVDELLSLLDELAALIAAVRALRGQKAEWVPCLEKMPAADVPVLIRGHAWPSPVVARLLLDLKLGIPTCWSDSDGDGSVYYLHDVHYWHPIPEVREDD